MKISAETFYHNLMQQPDTRLAIIDLDEFTPTDRPKVLTAMDEAQDRYGAVFQNDREGIGAVIVEDDDSRESGFKTLTQDTYMVCVFFARTPSKWSFILRQGKAQRKVWNAEQSLYTDTFPAKPPYYAFDLGFDGPMTEDEAAEFIVKILTFRRDLVSSIAELNSEERKAKFQDMGDNLR